MRRAVTAALSALLVVLLLPVSPAAAGSGPRVVIVVGPVGSSTAHYASDAADVAAEARRYTPNVITLITPKATWDSVKAAAQGASILVYLGHGNGWPSPYAPFQTVTKDGLGLDPTSGADGTRVVYYGEDYLRSSIRLAPNAVVLLYHLCYASGNTEPGLATGTFADARERVDNYGAGFIGAGARAVFAEGHPSHPVVDYVRQLFTTDRTMDQIFRSAPTRHGHFLGPYASSRTPGLQFEMDPDLSTPSGFYRSLSGDLALASGSVVGLGPGATDTNPTDFVVPGAAEVAGAGGAGLFATAAEAADPASAPGSALAAGTHLRIATEAAPAADGTRLFEVSVIGGTATGFTTASQLAPRDSASPVAWWLDQSAALLSPNGDGASDNLVVAARLSEAASTGLLVRNTSGTTVWSGSMTTDLPRFVWGLRTKDGALVPDGAYTWSMWARDAWGNPTLTLTGSFTVDGTAPTSTATVASTQGLAGWSVTVPVVTISATDALSGVGSISWRVDGGTIQAYAGPAGVTGDGVRRFEYRATDRAGIQEAWRTLALNVDTSPPAIALPLAGVVGDAAGTWRSPVTVTPAVGDAVSGLAQATVSLDGGAPVPLGGDPIVVDGDGRHIVALSATDLAGNTGSVTTSFLIDTVAPVISVTAPLATPPTVPTVSPNGDGRGDTVTVPYTVSEAAAVTPVVSDAAGAVVRTLPLIAAGTTGQATWDGRTQAGTAARDGRYTLTLTPRDPAGNAGAPVSAPVDVYSALGTIVRSPALFFPQDADALAGRSSVTFTLLSPARVSVTVINAGGTVVRTGFSNRSLPAGKTSWSWNGRLANGTWAPRGTYRFLVRATNGTQASAGSTPVIADAFQTATSVATATRGKAFTLTAITAERLSTAPVVTIRQPGLAAWSLRMSKVSATTWKVTIRPRTGGAAGTLQLTLRARDSAGGTNSMVVRRPLR